MSLLTPCEAMGGCTKDAFEKKCHGISTWMFSWTNNITLYDVCPVGVSAVMPNLLFASCHITTMPGRTMIWDELIWLDRAVLEYQGEPTDDCFHYVAFLDSAGAIIRRMANIFIPSWFS